MHDAPPAGWWLASDGRYYPPQPAAPRLPWVDPGRLLWGTLATALVLRIADLLG